jgi:hypothetical protein
MFYYTKRAKHTIRQELYAADGAQLVKGGDHGHTVRFFNIIIFLC